MGRWGRAHRPHVRVSQPRSPVDGHGTHWRRRMDPVRSSETCWPGGQPPGGTRSVQTDVPAQGPVPPPPTESMGPPAPPVTMVPEGDIPTNWERRLGPIARHASGPAGAHSDVPQLATEAQGRATWPRQWKHQGLFKQSRVTTCRPTAPARQMRGWARRGPRPPPFGRASCVWPPTRISANMFSLDSMHGLSNSPGMALAGATNAPSSTAAPAALRRGRLGAMMLEEGERNALGRGIGRHLQRARE